MNVLVLGASGMLGASLVPLLKVREHNVTVHGRHGPGYDLADLANMSDTLRLFKRISPQVVINLAGLTDVERCEAHPQDAWRDNVRAVENVAHAARTTETHMIHISTDHVYNGTSPQTEDRAVPGNYYALTKYAGELAALATRSTVLRSNFFGASRHPTRRSLTDWIFYALKNGQPIRVFEDVRFSPLSLNTTSHMIELVVRHRPLGIFNVGSREGMSKADFAFSFARTLNLPENLITRTTVRQEGTHKTWRPKDMRMDSAKFESTVDVTLPRLEVEIQRAAKGYHEAI